jgi:hypothetical protein
LAIAQLTGAPEARSSRSPGLFHTAITMAHIFDLLRNYERARALGIAPEKANHHGPTVSFYYRDPDGNECELLVDRFKTGDEAKAFMRGRIFAHTLGAGGELDPAGMLARMKAGASEEELLHYDEENAMKLDTAATLELYRKKRAEKVEEAGDALRRGDS